MSLHKLTAGSGYDYLTRQVAALDATDKGHTTLSSYYSEKGEAPGRWVGSGLAGIEGLSRGDVVTAEQMKALFAYGFHPLAEVRASQLGPTSTDADVRRARHLGAPYKVFAGDVSPYLVEVARRIEELNVLAGQSRTAPAPSDERARVRTEVAREYFEKEHGRPPASARELAATIARHSRPRTTAVSGFDLTFSPVKSVSTLWAIADPWISARVERAHDAAVRDALQFIESEALFTRRGTNGVRQVDVLGLVATSFTHRDSRAGDPDLHTHVAVANKVQDAEDGAWLSIDGRLLFRSAVTASEVYNTALEKHLTGDLGVQFVERPNADHRKRPVREIAGVSTALMERWSTRRANIAARKDELTVRFQADHGRPPTPVETIQLAQQATLETRGAKHEPRSLAEQRAAWHSEAAEALGSEASVRDMVDASLARSDNVAEQVDRQWINRTAEKVIDTLQQRRSTWLIYHVSAEVQRRLRSADLRPDQLRDVAKLVVDAALERSVMVTTDHDSTAEPVQLRRRDGSSVYSVAGSTLFSSHRVLDAEQRIVRAAGLDNGVRLSHEAVEQSIKTSAEQGLQLNAGQVGLVRGMATSGARVQLGIAAAGTGKTTAMRALTRAWCEDDGNVLGLAPSAAAAAQLREQTGATSDTLAKLIHGQQHGERSSLSAQIDSRTLVIIDEAGMADTLSLDSAIELALSRGASVRLIGDDQQLAAIGAGGVLRDIESTHGALRLSELLRFSDPAEGAAGLALRDGLPEALGFYLDHDRIHVGDVATLTREVFTAWQSDRDDGRDSIMLAPTRELTAELNRRARDARLHEGLADGVAARLADGNEASVGDVVLTRHNDRRLATSSTDWVKNGDRWTVEAVADDGALRVKHTRSGLFTTLPHQYVRHETELGYATTVHSAQGISVDTMHGIATGDESRQQLYTMLTRARHENHAYLVTASDGDPHGLIRPESVHPRTPTDILMGMLARDGAPLSATTLTRESASPEAQLGQAAARYEDALHFAARDQLGAETVKNIEIRAEAAVPGIRDEPAWPTLIAHLVLRQVQGRDAAADLERCVAERELDGVEDRAAILDWRLDPTGLRGLATGPLPWLPSVPSALKDDPTWGPYLDQRSGRVLLLADEVRRGALDEVPAWWTTNSARPSDDLLADLAIWRAANEVLPDDRRLTGRRLLQKAASEYQHGLDARIAHGRTAATAQWWPVIAEAQTRPDTFTPVLAERLAAMGRSGLDAAALFRRAVQEGTLPDEHVSAAIWWRVSRHLSPKVMDDSNPEWQAIEAPWSGLLIDALGPEPARTVMGSRQWPSLVATVEQALERRWEIHSLLDVARKVVADDVDLAQALVWQIGLVTDPMRDLTREVPEPDWDPPPPDMELAEPAPLSSDERLEEAAARRRTMGPREPTDAQINRLIKRAWDADHSPVSPERILELNEMAAQFFENRLQGSWAHEHVQTRLGQNVAGDERFRVGFAPADWTALVNHFRSAGVSEEEMITADLAQRASTGRLIDRFRDRVVLPIIDHGAVLGFVGRRNPLEESPKAGPKYLNTRDTVAFHKGAQLFGIPDDHALEGSIPVLVEGPFDALAVTLASGGAFLGVAPLGTALTDEQAAQLGRIAVDPVVATDGDIPGYVAAERAYWLLGAHDLQPRRIPIDAGDDPSELYEREGPAALVAKLQESEALASSLVRERLQDVDDPNRLASSVAEVLVLRPPQTWLGSIEDLAGEQSLDVDDLTRSMAEKAESLADDRNRFLNDRLGEISELRQRLAPKSSGVAGSKEVSSRQFRSVTQHDPRQHSPLRSSEARRENPR
ncbi:MobF family relaxase [Aeromicrobium sp. Root495]|uniref:MobF family relaxase n=1 Tax=Aeromicrobium sp. Root495 TaxID=1736550 RepID=UPI000A52375E|nr:MobF family relaxase [Aeromicrobium sp. Root495]